MLRLCCSPLFNPPAGSPVIAQFDGDAVLPDGMTPFIYEYHGELADLHADNTGQTVCRRCAQPVKDWWDVRKESLVTPIPRPNEIPEVGLGWRCARGALHLGEPLPARTGMGRPWNSLDDYVVQVAGWRCPIMCKVPSSTARPANRNLRRSGEGSGLFVTGGKGGGNIDGGRSDGGHGGDGGGGSGGSGGRGAADGEGGDTSTRGMDVRDGKEIV